MQSLLRLVKPIMSVLPKHAPTSITPTAARVPIPQNGVDYRNKIVLAPMVRSGELPMRLLSLHYGADLVWGPETVDRSMIGTNKRINPRTSCIEWTRTPSNGHKAQERAGLQKENVLYRIDPTREKGKLLYQIGTADPDLAVQSAKVVADYVSGFDVNAGCPKPFSTSGGMGAALLRTPDKLASILEALVEQVGKVWGIGISVKIRLLETPEMTEALVRRLCKTGITGLTVHCRLTNMRPRERAIREQLRMVGDVCREHGVACMMNGDVKDRAEGVTLAKEYGVDGGMIATAAEKNPSAFRPQEEGGLAPWREVMTKYLDFAMSVENKWGNTKFSISQLMPSKNPLYQQVTMTKGYSECCQLLEMDEQMLARAREVDEILGLGVEGPKQQQKKKRALQEGSNTDRGKRVDHKSSQTGDSEQVHSQMGFENIGQTALAV